MNNYFRDFQYINEFPTGKPTLFTFNKTLYPFARQSPRIYDSTVVTSIVEEGSDKWLKIETRPMTLSGINFLNSINDYYDSYYYFNPTDNKRKIADSNYRNINIEDDYILSISFAFKYNYVSTIASNRALIVLGVDEQYSIPLLYSLFPKTQAIYSGPANTRNDLTNNKEFSCNSNVQPMVNSFNNRFGDLFDLLPEEEYFLQFKVAKRNNEYFISLWIDGILFGSFKLEDSVRTEYAKFLPNNLIFVPNDSIEFQMKDFLIQSTYAQSNDFPMYSYYMDFPQEAIETIDNVSMEYSDFSKADHDEVVSSDGTTDTLDAFKSDTLKVFPMHEDAKQDFTLEVKQKEILQNKLTFQTGEPNLVDSLINEIQGAGVSYEFFGKYNILFKNQTDIPGIVYDTIPFDKENSYVENPNQYEVIQVIDTQKSVVTSLNQYTTVKNDSRYGMYGLSMVDSEVSGTNDWIDSLMTMKICFTGLPKLNTDNQVLHWIRNEEDDIFLDMYLHPDGKLAVTYENFAYVSDFDLNKEIIITYYRKDNLREMKINGVLIPEISLDDYSSMTFQVNENNKGISYDVISLVFTYNEKE